MTNLPQGWEVKKLEEIANIKGGKRLPKGENFVGGKIKCRKRKIKCRIFATNYLSFNLKLKL